MLELYYFYNICNEEKYKIMYVNRQLYYFYNICNDEKDKIMYVNRQL